MKLKVCIFAWLFLFCSMQSIAQIITLTYDAAGNRLTKQITGSIAPPVIMGDTSACQGVMVTFNAHGGATYLWSNGATDSVISITADTSVTYKVYSYTALGCADSITKRLTVLPVPVSGPIAGNTSIYLTAVPVYDTFTVPLHSGSFYEWSVSNGSVVSGYGTNQAIVAFISPGTGTVSVYESLYSGACSTPTVQMPDTVINEISLVPGNLKNGEIFTVYPNPSSNNVWVDYQAFNCNEITLTLINATGIVNYQNVYSGIGNFHVPLTDNLFAVPGIYTIQLISNSGIFTQKLTILK